MGNLQKVVAETMNVEDADVVVDGHRLRVRRLHHSSRQHDAPIVFLHDSWGCIELWRHFPKKLAELTHRDAIVCDRQGYGQSAAFTEPRTVSYLEDEARTLLRLLDQLHIPNAVLFGHSDGGSIALLAAAMAPSRMDAVVTEGAHVFVEEITIAGIEDGIKLYRETDLKQKLSKYHGDNTEGMFWAWADTWLKPEFRLWNIERYLHQIKCPVLVMQGERDQYGTEDQVDSIVKQVRGRAIKHMVPNVGHTPHRDAPKETVETAARFINELED